MEEDRSKGPGGSSSVATGLLNSQSALPFIHGAPYRIVSIATRCGPTRSSSSRCRHRCRPHLKSHPASHRQFDPRRWLFPFGLRELRFGGRFVKTNPALTRPHASIPWHGLKAETQIVNLVSFRNSRVQKILAADGIDGAFYY